MRGILSAKGMWRLWRTSSLDLTAPNVRPLLLAGLWIRVFFAALGEYDRVAGAGVFAAVTTVVVISQSTMAVARVRRGGPPLGRSDVAVAALQVAYILIVPGDDLAAHAAIIPGEFWASATLAIMAVVTAPRSLLWSTITYTSAIVMHVAVQQSRFNSALLVRGLWLGYLAVFIGALVKVIAVATAASAATQADHRARHRSRLHLHGGMLFLMESLARGLVDHRVWRRWARNVREMPSPREGIVDLRGELGSVRGIELITGEEPVLIEADVADVARLVVEEAANNVMKYGSGQFAQVTVQDRAIEAEVVVRDTGDVSTVMPSAVASGGLGVQTIKDALRDVGGTATHTVDTAGRWTWTLRVPSRQPDRALFRFATDRRAAAVTLSLFAVGVMTLSALMAGGVWLSTGAAATLVAIAIALLTVGVWGCGQAEGAPYRIVVWAVFVGTIGLYLMNASWVQGEFHQRWADVAGPPMFVAGAMVTLVEGRRAHLPVVVSLFAATGASMLLSPPPTAGEAVFITAIRGLYACIAPEVAVRVSAGINALQRGAAREAARHRQDQMARRVRAHAGTVVKQLAETTVLSQADLRRACVLAVQLRGLVQPRLEISPGSVAHTLWTLSMNRFDRTRGIAPNLMVPLNAAVTPSVADAISAIIATAIRLLAATGEVPFLVIEASDDTVVVVFGTTDASDILDSAAIWRLHAVACDAVKVQVLVNRPGFRVRVTAPLADGPGVAIRAETPPASANDDDAPLRQAWGLGPVRPGTTDLAAP